MPTGPDSKRPLVQTPSPSAKAREPVAPIRVTGEQDFAIAADFLNERISNAVELFKAIPAKSQGYVLVDDSFCVSFERFSNEWTFGAGVGNFQNTKIWHQCSLEEKTKIASALPALYKTITSDSNQRIHRLVEAHRAIDVLEQTAQSLKEGK